MYRVVDPKKFYPTEDNLKEMGINIREEQGDIRPEGNGDILVNITQ